jgi:hypothetical protein
MTNAGSCMNCGRGQMEVPLLEVTFRDGDWWICSQCFPILIHKPEQLAGKLAGAESLSPSEHDHD